ncbi:MAG TPA: pyruvate:ferredoxin (flavodoxin) oxidoreductase [Candidatus Omnitrophota bacterium]|nr:pyruvate:ferredoxin (flavodoxin) oxidoreductase [Candidatus Omnitrophota bacterium]
MSKSFITMDANEAVAHVAYRINECIAIYPITPSSPMGEWADQWASEGRKNIWGTIPSVAELQSEGGAAGTVHGALQRGALTTTFTASQGLLLMIPNMYKIAGELTSMVMHVSARSLACQALSIFGDHSDVMAVRQTGYAMLASASVQEATDFALISQAASLESRIPFLHFFDGFRTSHEVQKISMLSDDQIRGMIDMARVLEHRARALSPDNPVLRGTAQNPDVYFQGRETVNKFYEACPDAVQRAMDKFAGITGRAYRLFEYVGAKDAEQVIVIMGSGVEVADEAVKVLAAKGAKIGCLKVALYRPFDVKRFVEALPSTIKNLIVLDRTKEPGAIGEPLYLDCVSALQEAAQNGWSKFKQAPKVYGGRYGLSSKEFTPAMVKGVFDFFASGKTKHGFTIGINDDVTHTSLPYDPDYSIESDKVVRALFYGLGSDGTVGANKNSIKIIGENTENFAQGYFVYDSKKSGAITVSHLRFGPEPIRSPYLISKAHFVACHQTVFLEKYDMLRNVIPGGTFLLNAPWSAETVWPNIPIEVQREIIAKKLKFYVIDAYKVAAESGMGMRINTIMQVCFFAISGVLPREQAIAEIKKSIEKTYGKKGEEVVRQNLQAVDMTLAHLHEVKVPAVADSKIKRLAPVTSNAPAFVKDVLGTIIEGRGDDLPVSAMPVDGTFPTATTQYEKRNIALEIPVWEPEICIQCGKCNFVCPHAVIRMKVYDPKYLEKAPEGFKSADAKMPDFKGQKFTIQPAPEDCTGCGLCVDVCPAKSKTDPKKKAINMHPQAPLRCIEAPKWDYFLSIPDYDRRKLKTAMINQQQAMRPLFEFSGACAGCGETPYVKVVSQLFGDRAVIANATGCSSIYGGNLPTTPWAKDANGRGPAWSNSLFEDAAEFAYGFRMAIDKQKEYASELLVKLQDKLGADLVKPILSASQQTESEIYDQRERVAQLKKKLAALNNDPDATQLLSLADTLVKKSVWAFGGDGWAYDIGFGGLDHVLASGKNVNVFVLDTEVYSNTGGQASKATPRSAIARFAMGGKPTGKKNLGLIAMTYGNVYVASIAMGANDQQALKAIQEAESYDGPSLIIAYSHCIAHGINMINGLQDQKAAVASGQWILYRFDPRKVEKGENPLMLDSRAPSLPLEQYLMMENRFKMLVKSNPSEAKKLFQLAQKDVEMRWRLFEYLSQAKSQTEAPQPPAA